MINVQPGLQEIVSANKLNQAWDWLVNEVQVRPIIHGRICLFDNKLFRGRTSGPVFQNSCKMLSVLYIASQLGDHRSVLQMAHGHPGTTVCCPHGSLDNDVQNVIRSQKRFRHHLAEHLAFWIRLAVERKLRGPAYRPATNEFVYSKPNIQPEDKGPDGLYLEILPTCKLEIQSVKSSINNPQQQISSAKFRKTGVATQKKLLDDFWFFAHENDGLLRLDELLDRSLTSLGASTSSTLRLGLVKQASYNAIAVADAKYSREGLFEGYEHVTPLAEKRIGTYIGSSNWRVLSAEVHREVQSVFADAGMLV